MSNLPLVSVIMPIRNEAEFIERSLGAVLAQDYQREQIEVLVADGMSTDGTRNIVRLIEEQDQRIQLLDNPLKITSAALNVAMATARGSIIIWVGGHTEIASNYVRECVRHLLETGADCVGGPIETLADTAIGRAIARAMASPFGVGGVAFRTQHNRHMEVDTVAFGAYRRSAIEKCGPLDEEFVRNQDDEYNYRLRSLGGRILLSPDIRSKYHSRTSLKSLWRQYFQYGYWKVRVLQMHPRQMRPRQFAPPTFVATLLGALLLAPLSRLLRKLLVVVCGCYLCANLAASLLIAREHGRKHLRLLPVAFATLHLSYGLGFLVGLVKFWNRWTDKRTRASISLGRNDAARITHLTQSHTSWSAK